MCTHQLATGGGVWHISLAGCRLPAARQWGVFACMCRPAAWQVAAAAEPARCLLPAVSCRRGTPAGIPSWRRPRTARPARARSRRGRGIWLEAGVSRFRHGSGAQQPCREGIICSGSWQAGLLIRTSVVCALVSRSLQKAIVHACSGNVAVTQFGVGGAARACICWLAGYPWGRTAITAAGGHAFCARGNMCASAARRRSGQGTRGWQHSEWATIHASNSQSGKIGGELDGRAEGRNVQIKMGIGREKEWRRRNQSRNKFCPRRAEKGRQCGGQCWGAL